MNYFELFEFPVMPAVNKEMLTARYRMLQRQTHPDRHTGKTAIEKQEMEELSADVNKAYAVFKDEHKTLEYFLRVKGWMPEEEKYVLPSDFLMEMMELNEMLEEEGKEPYKQAIDFFEQELDQSARSLLDRADQIGEQEGKEILVPYYLKKKYLLRLLDRLKD